MTMLIESVMKREVVSIGHQGRLQEAIDLLIGNRIGILPVVNAEGVLIGIVRLRDLLELVLPAFVAMVEDYDFVQDFGRLEMGKIPEEVRAAPVRDIMAEPLAVEVGSGLLRAHAFMRQHNLHDLPVVNGEGRLVGLASWVDVGVGFLKSASEPQSGAS